MNEYSYSSCCRHSCCALRPNDTVSKKQLRACSMKVADSNVLGFLSYCYSYYLPACLLLGQQCLACLPEVVAVTVTVTLDIIEDRDISQRKRIGERMKKIAGASKTRHGDPQPTVVTSFVALICCRRPRPSLFESRDGGPAQNGELHAPCAAMYPRAVSYEVLTYQNVVVFDNIVFPPTWHPSNMRHAPLPASPSSLTWHHQRHRNVLLTLHS